MGGGWGGGRTVGLSAEPRGRASFALIIQFKPHFLSCVRSKSYLK